MTQTASRFCSDGVDLAFMDEGHGQAVILIHGFASNVATNWVFPGWVATFIKAGYRVVALDNRGHGNSQKLYDSAAYRSDVMADDVARMMDHLCISKAYIMGYSMGARIAAFFCIHHADRVKAAIFAGLAMGLVDGLPGDRDIGEALAIHDPALIKNAQARAFRTFADQTKSDRLALAACISHARSTISVDEFTKLSIPIMVAVGSLDELAGDLDSFVALIPGAEGFEIAGRDHMSAVGDRSFKAAALDFFVRHD